jgi:hypothetical protein
MKRFHVHVSVSDLSASIQFYSGLFRSDPTVHRPDYAKWMLEDPRINFAISSHRADASHGNLAKQVRLGGSLQRVVAKLALEFWVDSIWDSP